MSSDSESLSWEIERHPPTNRLDVRVRGAVTLQGLASIGRDLLERGQLRRPAYLWDFREADLSSLTLEDVRRIWATRRKSPDAPAIEVRRALVVGREVDFAILRQALMTSDQPTEASFRVFRDVDAARAWLEEP